MAPEVEFVELIEVDPRAFGGTGTPPAPKPQRVRRQKGRGPRTRVSQSSRLGIAACVLAVIGLGAALVLVRPWVPDLRITLDDPRVLSAELSERLIIDPAPSELRTAALPDGSGPTFEEWAGNTTGYFFAEAGATFDPQRGEASWFGFYAKSAADPTTPIVAGLSRINGAPAEISDESNGRIVNLYWGPIDGYMFRAIVAHSSADEARRVAEHLHVVDGRVVVDDRRALGNLRPIAAFGDYVALDALYRYAYDYGQSVDGMVGVYYGFSGESVVSMPGNASALDMVPFLLSTNSKERSVHGMRAVGFEKGAGPFGSIDRSTVIWWEGGRLILVAGGDDLDATFRLAERVRPATDAEWAKVTDLVDTVDTGVRT